MCKLLESKEEIESLKPKFQILKNVILDTMNCNKKKSKKVFSDGNYYFLGTYSRVTNTAQGRYNWDVGMIKEYTFDDKGNWTVSVAHHNIYHALKWQIWISKNHVINHPG